MIKIFWIGLSISFLGSLPLGTINVAAMQIGMTETVQAAFTFSLGALLVEMAYVRVSLVAMDWVRRQERLFQILEWATVLLIVALAMGSFWAAMSESGAARNVLLSNGVHRFVLGMTMRALNPALIPFWFGWSTVLLSKGVLQPVGSQYNAYILGIGLGTLLAHGIFILGGSLAADLLASHQAQLNWAIGGVFMATAGIQVWRMFKKRTV